MNHLNAFNRAWECSRFTKIELDPLDINGVLGEHYSCGSRFCMTKSQLWDMEVMKARRPDLFIPSVVQPNSALAWGGEIKGNVETFTRVSLQRLWLDETKYGTVIESVHVDHSSKIVTFIGELQATSAEYGNFKKSKTQPVFHVQHGVQGDEGNPQNTWKIVHLSSKNKENLKERFKKIDDNKWLPEYVEIYLTNIIGLALNRKHA
ncbi:hypothetical protein QTP81_11090 [Alteromonas sp. ASW11-36]|uniref:Uncharacterized protein n=1 Tax=Alteromonas arenosi TaxID=3055817 RepID=A0ABT7SY76_9ALTE|nr:hypothetical protein [Alteromonas sp. ASW11-36]MDM7861143.1 hypothetical protein [Alteromonas sp. ASW11-36]